MNEVVGGNALCQQVAIMPSISRDLCSVIRLLCAFIALSTVDRGLSIRQLQLLTLCELSLARQAKTSYILAGVDSNMNSDVLERLMQLLEYHFLRSWSVRYDYLLMLK